MIKLFRVFFSRIFRFSNVKKKRGHLKSTYRSSRQALLEAHYDFWSRYSSFDSSK